MASVSSLDQDMRNLRMSRYTPAAANEARAWIEDTLGHSIQSGDLLEALKDGVALCELANLALPAPGIKYKKSPMPFVQMENISHFLRACEMPPLNLPAHDRFLTVDLYEAKDPAQVLQCLGAFSRRAQAVNAARITTTIGPKKAGALSPTSTGQMSNSAASWKPTTYSRPTNTAPPSAAMPSSARAMSPTLTGGSTGSQGSASKASAAVSSWSKRSDQGATAPAWNIHQYGYMGGASQGNQGISFGARRQITSQGPSVPSLAEKERQRKEKEAEDERNRRQQEDDERQAAAEREKREEQERRAEEIRWEEESKRLREEERRRMDEQKRQWAEQEKQWREEEEETRRREAQVSRSMKPPETPRTASGSILRGQTLSQYQREQSNPSNTAQLPQETPEQAHVKQLEKQLEEAREREKQYQAEREERLRQEKERGSRPSSAQTERPETAKSGRDSELSWAGDEREYLRKQWHANQEGTPSKLSESTTAEDEGRGPSLPSRHLPQPADDELPRPEAAEDGPPPPPPNRSLPPPQTSSSPLPLSSANRPLPKPENKSPFTRPANRAEAYLSSNPAPSVTAPRISSANEAGDTALEQSALRDQRVASQQKTRAGAWASKSLLEREMERERERQREWEANQAVTKGATRDTTEGSGQGQSWDVNQYGYTGGDNMNRGSSSGSGIGMGGRRQIIGPRPPP